MINDKVSTDKEVLELQKSSRIHNTDKCIAKWLRTVNRYREVANYESSLENILTSNKLEDFLCKLIIWLKKVNENDYKATRLKVFIIVKTSKKIIASVKTVNLFTHLKNDQ